MLEAALQILLILAYVAVGLIAVIFPIYALCVTYLKVEKSEIEKERKQRLKNIQWTIGERTKILQGEQDLKRLKQTKAEIKKYEDEKKGLEVGLGSLTAKGAVRNPLVCLVIALSAASFGIVFADLDIIAAVFFSGAVSLGFCIVAVNSLYVTISRIEHAALRTLRTVDFEICYKSRNTTQEVKCGVAETISIGIKPEEDVENFEMRMFVPPQIELKDVGRGRVTVQPEGFVFQGYSTIVFEMDLLPSTSFRAFSMRILAKQTGNFVIAVYASGKGLQARSTDLQLQVK
jgi:hypothetical protein